MEKANMLVNYISNDNFEVIVVHSVSLDVDTLFFMKNMSSLHEKAVWEFFLIELVSVEVWIEFLNEINEEDVSHRVKKGIFVHSVILDKEVECYGVINSLHGFFLYELMCYLLGLMRRR